MTGDSGDGFDEFLLAEGRRLFGLARVLCGNEHDAWDVWQDAMIRIGARWSHVRNRHDPLPYARRTLINVNLNRVRRARHEVPVDELPERPDHEHGGDRHVETDWLEKAVDALPARQKAAITLVYLYGLTMQEVAEALDCSVSSAKTHLTRARQAIRSASPSSIAKA
jgi:RNA polymerase sigma factor (sigma-70 family)